MKKIATVIGARPQFIKHAPLQTALEGVFREYVIHTGQHYDDNMSDIFFRQMGIKKPDCNLNLGSLSHGSMTGRMLAGIEDILIKESPDLLVIYGDTNSTLAGALAAAKLNIPIAHIESGLRSYNKRMPEEINRIIADRISDILFAPTKNAMKNLADEGLKGVMSGDIMLDAFKLFSKKAVNVDVEQISGVKGPFILMTLHREENTTENNLKRIIKNISSTGLNIVFPVHPRTKKLISKVYSEGYLEKRKIHAIPPQGYIENLALLINSEAVITDSGGLQKEAYFASKKCITIRSETEWIETLTGGANTICPYGECPIEEILGRKKKTSFGRQFGSGKAAYKIVKHIGSFLYEDK